MLPRPAPMKLLRSRRYLYSVASFLTALIVIGASTLLLPDLFAADAPRGGGREPLTVDAFSVVKVRVKAVADARSRQSLGGDREGTGVVIDSSGLILTIGYLVQEA